MTYKKNYSKVIWIGDCPIEDNKTIRVCRDTEGRIRIEQFNGVDALGVAQWYEWKNGSQYLDTSAEVIILKGALLGVADNVIPMEDKTRA